MLSLLLMLTTKAETRGTFSGNRHACHPLAILSCFVRRSTSRPHPDERHAGARSHAHSFTPSYQACHPFKGSRPCVGTCQAGSSFILWRLRFIRLSAALHKFSCKTTPSCCHLLPTSRSSVMTSRMTCCSSIHLSRGYHSRSKPDSAQIRSAFSPRLTKLLPLV